MRDIVERLRKQADEIVNANICGWGNTNLDAAYEIEALRQQVKDCEREHKELFDGNYQLAKELAALKAGQGEPVGWVDDVDGEVTNNDNVAERWVRLCKHSVSRIYTSAPTIPDGENEAVRMFLMYYGGHNGVTIEGMRECLTLSGFDGCWPAWAEDVGHLTKAGAQDWIKHLLFAAPKPGNPA